MEAAPNFDLSSLKAEYLGMKKVLYRKFIIFLVILFMGLCSIESLRALIQLKFISLVHVPCLIGFSAFALKYLRKPNGSKQNGGLIFCIAFYIYSIALNYYGNIGYFDTPIDTFYFAYIMCFIERFTVWKIPTFQHRVIYNVATTIIRILIIPPNQSSTYVRQVLFLGLNIYLDMDHEKHHTWLFMSYFNYKEQMVKFKDLVVQDIPEGIVIVSKDLTESFFMNNSFRQLFKENNLCNIRSQLDQFIFQEEVAGQESTRKAKNPRKTLLSFLEKSLVYEHELLEKLACNLNFTKVTLNNNGEQARQECIIEAKIFPIVWDKIPSIAILLNDVTQQSMLLSLQIADAQKDLVLATVSHELRTPLNGMLGMIQVIEKRTRDIEIQNYLSICKNSGNLLLGLVNSILDLHQLRSHKLQLNPETVNINTLLKEIKCLFELQCVQKRIYLKEEISASTPSMIVTDKNRLVQIFINLIGNAVKYTVKGGITILVREAKEKDYIEFSVKDTGVGIKEEDKGKLFQMFGRVEDKNSNLNKHGVGLGLTISDSLAQKLGRSVDNRGIQMHSVYQEGTTFTFLIKKRLRNDTSGEEDFEDADSLFDNFSSNDSADFRLRKYLSSPKSNAQVLQGQMVSPLSRKKASLIDSEDSHSLSPTQLYQPRDRKQSTLLLQAKPSILVVDDNSFNLVVAEQVILSYGYIAVPVLSGQAAIDLLLNRTEAKLDIKLILMDCQMPFMDGFETTKILRDLMFRRKIPEIPIIALTASQSEISKRKGLQAGMCDHLNKPLEIKELQKIFQKYLGYQGEY